MPILTGVCMRLKKAFTRFFLVLTAVLFVFDGLSRQTSARADLPLRNADMTLSYATVNDTFEVQFTIHDIVRMKSFHLHVNWDDTQMSTDAQNVFIKSFLPPPYAVASIIFGDELLPHYSFVQIDVQIPCEKPSINGTGELFGIRFKALNPWAANDGGIPTYAFALATPPDHGVWYPKPCWNYINIGGYIDKLEIDGSIALQYLGTEINVVGPNVNPNNPPTYTIDGNVKNKTVTNVRCAAGGFIMGYYEFRPVPGDLNLDGHTDVVDLAAIAAVYGKTSADPNWATKYIGFDLDTLGASNGVIDLSDLVIVAKNICRTAPDAVNPFPLPDP